jgi:hypothetical protein
MIITPPHTNSRDDESGALFIQPAKSQSEIMATLKFIIGRGDFCVGRQLGSRCN